MNDETNTAGQYQKVVVTAFISDGDRVLLAKRSVNKSVAAGEYHLPGGHVEFGEEVPAALEREIWEELAVRIEIGEPYFVFSYLNGLRHTVGVAYLASLLDPADHIRPDPAETESVVWVTEEDLPIYFPKAGHNLRAAILGFEKLNGRVKSEE